METSIAINWNTIVLAVIAGLPAVLVGVATLWQQIKTHATFNSKMDLLLKTTNAAAYARGQADAGAASSGVDVRTVDSAPTPTLLKEAPDIAKAEAASLLTAPPAGKGVQSALPVTVTISSGGKPK